MIDSMGRLDLLARSRMGGGTGGVPPVSQDQPSPDDLPGKRPKWLPGWVPDKLPDKPDWWGFNPGHIPGEEDPGLGGFDYPGGQGTGPWPWPDEEPPRVWPQLKPWQQTVQKTLKAQPGTGVSSTFGPRRNTQHMLGAAQKGELDFDPSGAVTWNNPFTPADPAQAQPPRAPTLFDLANRKQAKAYGKLQKLDTRAPRAPGVKQQGRGGR